jgi:hypothetical protein
VHRGVSDPAEQLKQLHAAMHEAFRSLPRSQPARPET